MTFADAYSVLEVGLRVAWARPLTWHEVLQAVSRNDGREVVTYVEQGC